MRFFGCIFAFALLACAADPVKPTFNRDILPILENRCQECHRRGEIAPMPFMTFRETRPWAKAIREAVLTGKMPPWFADPRYGHFANDRHLSQEEKETLAAWVDAGAPEGLSGDRPRPKQWFEGWNIGKPDAIISMPTAFHVPARDELDYQYIIVHTGFTEDKCVQKVEIRPGNRAVVHHAVVYIREPKSDWLRDAAIGKPFALDPDAITKSDILFTYAPGNGHDEWPPGMAKLVPAGSDLVFQMHYTPCGKPVADKSEIGMIFASAPPAQRVLTLQLNYSRFVIPPGDPDYRTFVSGTLPNDATLLSLFPHMHLRGKWFEYAITPPGGERTTLLKVNNYDFYWQMTYRLAEPMRLPANTKIEAIASYDNSRNNPRNPDPELAVRYGHQSSDEMMVGFFDVAVDAQLDKPAFFRRPGMSNR